MNQDNKIVKPQKNILYLVVCALFLIVCGLIYFSYKQNLEIRKTISEISNVNDENKRTDQKIKKVDQKVNDLINLVNKLTDNLVQSQTQNEQDKSELKQLRKDLNILANKPTPTPYVRLGVTSVEPNNIPQNYVSKKLGTLTITGQGFEQNTKIEVFKSKGSLPLGGGSVTFISSSKLDFKLPSNLTNGYYDLLLKNSDSSQYLLKGAFLITSQTLQ